MEARDPLAALDVLDSEIAPALAVLLDFHEALADQRVVRRLRDLTPRLVAEQRCVVILAPELRLPEGLVAQTAVVRMSLPTRRGSRRSSTRRSSPATTPPPAEARTPPSAARAA